jgi:DNA-binding NarL/FixJ family response regulator
MVHKVPILVVGDPTAIRSSVRDPLARNPEWEICCEVEDDKEAVGKVRELRPHVVVLVMSKPLMGRLECIHEIRRIAPTMKFLALSKEAGPNGMKASLLGRKNWSTRDLAFTRWT